MFVLSLFSRYFSTWFLTVLLPAFVFIKPKKTNTKIDTETKIHKITFVVLTNIFLAFVIQVKEGLEMQIKQYISLPLYEIFMPTLLWFKSECSQGEKIAGNLCWGKWFPLLHIQFF